MNKKTPFFLLVFAIIFIFSQGCKKDDTVSAPQIKSDEVNDIPASVIHINDDKKYVLIGPDKETLAFKMALGVIVVLAPNERTDELDVFLKKVYEILPKRYVMAQLIPPGHSDDKDYLWPTRKRKTQQEFTTEEFVNDVISDLSTRFRLNSDRIFTFSWGQAGLAGYSVSLQRQNLVKGSFIAMAAFDEKLLPNLENAKGHCYYIYHCPEDKVYPFNEAQIAQKKLIQNKAKIAQLVTYEGGFGWRGDFLNDIRKGIRWLEIASIAQPRVTALAEN